MTSGQCGTTLHRHDISHSQSISQQIKVVQKMPLTEVQWCHRTSKQ